MCGKLRKIFFLFLFFLLLGHFQSGLIFCKTIHSGNSRTRISDENRKIKIPKTKGNPILIDGLFSNEEWKDATIIELDPSTKLFLQQYKGDVFLGVKNDGGAWYVDLYLENSNQEIFNLHASMQIGERLLKGDSWSDNDPAWLWGNHTSWIANEAKTDASKDKNLPFSQRLFRREGVEFQIRRSRFPGKQWRMRIEIRDFAGKQADVIFPKLSERKNTDKWLLLELN